MEVEDTGDHHDGNVDSKRELQPSGSGTLQYKGMDVGYYEFELDSNIGAKKSDEDNDEDNDDDDKEDIDAILAAISSYLDKVGACTPSENASETVDEVYGSALYVPRLPNDAVNTLISGIQKEIIDGLTAILPSLSTSALSLTSETSEISSPVLTYFIWERRERNTCYALESMILPGVLTHESLTNFMIYMFNKESIINAHPSKRNAMISEMINQAGKSPIPCILYVPKIDEIVIDLKDESKYIFEQLIQLRGKHVLVLATSSNPPEENYSLYIRSMFSRSNKYCHNTRKPNTDERKKFFAPIFLSVIANGKDIVKAALENAMDKLFADTINRTNEHAVDQLTDLYDALTHESTKYHSNSVGKDGLIRVGIQNILLEYSKNRLQFHIKNEID